MSCGGGGCGSCGPAAGAAASDESLLATAPSLDTRALALRIQHIAAKLRVQLEAEQGGDEAVDKSQAAEWSALFNDVGVTLAGGNAQSVKVSTRHTTRRRERAASGAVVAVHSTPD